MARVDRVEYEKSSNAVLAGSFPGPNGGYTHHIASLCQAPQPERRQHRPQVRFTARPSNYRSQDSAPPFLLTPGTDSCLALVLALLERPVVLHDLQGK